MLQCTHKLINTQRLGDLNQLTTSALLHRLERDAAPTFRAAGPLPFVEPDICVARYQRHYSIDSQLGCLLNNKVELFSLRQCLSKCQLERRFHNVRHRVNYFQLSTIVFQPSKCTSVFVSIAVKYKS